MDSMQLPNKSVKNQVAKYAALSLLFSYLEMFIPKILPFFKLGFGNIAVLMALEFSFPDFFLLLILKSVATSLTSGTLFSPFFIISLVQSVVSGFGMFVLGKLKKSIISVYGISIFGAVLSVFVQILLCRFYLGNGVNAFLGIMILFSIPAGILTAYLSEKIQSKNLLENLDFNSEDDLKNDTEKPILKDKKNLCKIILIAILLPIVFINNNFYGALGLFVLCLLIQKISGRKILFLPFLWLWIFVIVTSLFSPSGKVIFSVWKISITKGALLDGFIKALKLSSAASLSQSATTIRFSQNNIFGRIFLYYGKLYEKITSSPADFGFDFLYRFKKNKSPK